MRRFRDRLVLTDAEFRELEEELRNRAFTIARVSQASIIQDARDALLDAYTGGGTFADFNEQIGEIMARRGWTGISDWHAETIFRTVVQSDYGSGRLAQHRAMSAEFPFWQYDAVGDSRTRPEHAALDGRIYPADHPFWAQWYPPSGFNCILPGNVVRGSFTAGVKSFYRGKAFEIATVGGKRVTVTGNHPVATPQGLVPAKAIREGDHLLTYASWVEGGTGAEGGEIAVRPRLPRAHEPDVLSPCVNKDNGPAAVEQVFGALAKVGQVIRTEARPDDLDGDGAFGDGYVDVVTVDGVLLNDFAEVRRQSLRDRSLVSVNEPSGASAGTGAGDSVRIGANHAADSLPGSAALPLNGSRVSLEFGPFEGLRFGATPDLDAILPEDARESRPRKSEIVAELLERFPGLVAADEVVNVREFDWSGHVYDFQSASGFIVADGLLLSNCRCSVRVLTAGEAIGRTISDDVPEKPEAFASPGAGGSDGDLDRFDPDIRREVEADLFG